MEEPVLRHQAMAAAAEAAEKLSIADLQRSLRRPRTLFNFVLSTLTTLLTLAALLPLFSVVYMLVVKGLHRLTWQALTTLPPAPLEEGGGFGNAILGTLVMVGLAALLSISFGIATAVFLAETGPETRLAQAVRFGVKMLSGFPSILAGVLAYGAVVLVTGKFSAVAGGVALSVLMLPTVVLTAEDALRMVPVKIKEAAIGMGATRTQVIWHILIPTAMPGILTGVMLAIARAAGETAPLLFTALFSNFWINSRGHVDLMQGTASLAVLIYKFSGSSYDNQVEMAWTAALVLVVLVLTFNLIGQAFSHRNR
jgi:phosphate transport system permease protein